MHYAFPVVLLVLGLGESITRSRLEEDTIATEEKSVKCISMM